MPACVVCAEPATQVHQRHASSTELAELAADPENPSVSPGETDALIAVYTCERDAPPEEVAGLIHQSWCTPPCSCTPDQPEGQPPLFPST